MITLPYSVYHKSFIAEHGLEISKIIKNRLLMTPDAALRDVRKDQVDAIIKAIDNISRRFMPKEQREQEAEVLRLELCSMSLRSNYLERRIQGIKDLTTIIKNNSLYSNSKTFTTEFLIEWLVKNDTLTQIWDNRYTHLQLV